MDRGKVAAGLAVKHEKLLNYLYIPSFTTPESEDGAMAKLCGLEYGFDFIEKFIQLPFILPVPTNDDLNRYLVSLTSVTEVTKEVGISVGTGHWLLDRLMPKLIFKRTYKTKTKAAGTRQKTGQVEPETAEKSQKERRESIKIQVSEDYDTIEKVIKLVAPALERNPRRIKQFINLFRLRVYIATETGLFDIPEGSNEVALTLEQLGKFVAIQLKWPLLLVDLERYPMLIKELQLKALSLKKTDDMPEVREVTRWSSRNDLMSLLREGCVNEKGELDTEKRQVLSLEHVNLMKLLQVSPKVKDIEYQLKSKLEIDENLSSSRVEAIEKPADTNEQKGNKKKIDKIPTAQNDRKHSLAQFRAEFSEISNLPPQERGLKFEGFLFRLFKFFNLNPSKSFRNQGEQIDGSFQLGNDLFLIEGKWIEQKTGVKDLMSFQGQIDSRPSGVRGLFISISGFNNSALEAFSRGRSSSIICMDGVDLMDILEGTISLSDAIKIKLRYAGEANIIFEHLSTLIERYDQ